ncbi:hypothetical protein [Rhodococcus pyridinivorans]|uniref:hypothetical protein n=1 Tax=Rhodococcus pyridinivorans TaxID=103816 RepID=UPI00110F5879|nr:hypothetical protein [Rhodococcus pyridinivorans]
MNHETTPRHRSIPSVQRLGDDALLLTGDAVTAVHWLLNVSISARFRNGRNVPTNVAELARQLTGRGQINTAAGGFGHARADVIGVDEFARILGLSRRQARRIAATIGRLEAGRWVIDTDTAHHYARNRTA